MELRNEVSDLKLQLKNAHEPSAPAGDFRKQRSLDYVDNLEKQHVKQLHDAIVSALSERRRLLKSLTEHTRALTEARDGATDA